MRQLRIEGFGGLGFPISLSIWSLGIIIDSIDTVEERNPGRINGIQNERLRSEITWTEILIEAELVPLVSAVGWVGAESKRVRNVVDFSAGRWRARWVALGEGVWWEEEE